MKKNLLLCALVATGIFGLMAAAVIGYQDWQAISAPGNPSSGYVRMWYDSSAGIFKCLTSGGSACYFSSNVTGATLQTNGTNNSSQSTLNLQSGGSVVVANPSGGNVSITGPAFQIGGTANSTQTLLNFTAGSNITLTNPSGGVVNIAAANSIHGIGMAWGQGGVSYISTGTTSVPVPFGCTIGGTWYAYSDQTVTFDVLVNGSSITASAQPSAAAGANSGSTSTWTTSISAGNLLGWKILSISGNPTTASVVIPCQ